MTAIEDLVAVYAPVVAYPKWCGIDKADARTVAKGKVLEIDSQGWHRIRTEFHHAVIADHIRKMAPQMFSDVTIVEGLEIAEATKTKQHLYLHHQGKGQFEWSFRFLPLPVSCFSNNRTNSL